MTRLMRVIVMSLLVSSASLLAQTQDEPLFNELTKTFKKDYLSFGVLFQSVADLQIERSFSGNNGFNISNMRINLYGELDNGFGYLFKINVINSPAILDAKMYYGISSGFTVDIGQFKSPFSAEFLTGAGSQSLASRQRARARPANRRAGQRLDAAENVVVCDWRVQRQQLPRQ